MTLQQDSSEPRAAGERRRYLVRRQGLTMRRVERTLSGRDREERDSIELALIAAIEHLIGVDETDEQVVDVDVLIAQLRQRNWVWGI